MSTSKNKKSNVINKTTSETLRLTDTDVTISHRVIPPSNTHTNAVQAPRKKLTAASNSFQITAVSITRADVGEDSADDLDESHTDDISRITDNETPSFSEDSKDIEDASHAYETTQVLVPLSTQFCAEKQLLQKLDPSYYQQVDVTETTKINSEIVNAKSFVRGRWTCLDYMEMSESKDIDKKTNLKQQSSGGSNENYDFYEDRPKILPSENKNDKPSSSSSNIETTTVIKNTILMDNENANDILTNIQIALKSTSVSPRNPSSASNNNIDKKIEEALDAVKTHLMVAVHKEVDFLKTRVSTLEGRIHELENENSILKIMTKFRTKAYDKNFII